MTTRSAARRRNHAARELSRAMWQTLPADYPFTTESARTRCPASITDSVFAEVDVNWPLCAELLNRDRNRPLRDDPAAVYEIVKARMAAATAAMWLALSESDFGDQQ